MFRQGQAAMEFLTTYGWAFMVILVAIGALSYLGVTNTDGLVPDRCLSSQGLSCAEFQVTNERVRVFVNNELGEVIRLNKSSFSVTSVSTGQVISVVDCYFASDRGPIVLSPNQRAELACEISGLSVGSKERLEFNGEYTRSSGRYAQPFKIELVAAVQGGATTPPPDDGGGGPVIPSPDPVTCDGYAIGQTSCKGDVVIVCRDDGNWVEEEECQIDSSCVENPTGSASCVEDDGCPQHCWDYYDSDACDWGHCPVCDDSYCSTCNFC